MSIITALFANKTYGFEDAFKSQDITSTWMKQAIQEWYNLFYDIAPNEHEDPCQRIPYTVVNKLTKTMFGEYKAASEDGFTQSILDGLNEQKVRAVHAAMIGGEAFIKPFPGLAKMNYSIINRSNFLVFGRDENGNITDIGTAERTTRGSQYYTLLERRTINAERKLTIRNQLYVSQSETNLGVKTSLQALDRYAMLEPEYTYDEPIGIGLASIKTPVPNCVDGSMDGVSVYAAAVGLIHRINQNEAQLSGEFERGKSRIVVAADMMTTGPDGERRALKDDVFVALDENPQDIGITIFSPALREASFLARKTEYLRNVESVIGIKRGLLSDVEAAERTAKEITSSEGDYNLTIIDFQAMWEKSLREAAVLSGQIGQMYSVDGAHDIAPEDITVDWGNGVLYDEEKTWEDYKDMVARGLIKPEIAVGWRFNMPTETEQDLNQIREKYLPEVDSLLNNVGGL